MGIQISGLASGMDVDSMVAELIKAERVKVEKVEKQKTMVEWQRDVWSELNSTMYSFYKKELFNFKTSSSYNKKTITSSNENIVFAKATASTLEGNHTIKVTQLAKSSHLTGSALGNDLSGEKITKDTKMEELMNFTGETAIINIYVDAEDDWRSITINKTDTLGKVTSALDQSGIELDVSFDSTFNRIFISGKNTGTGNQIKLGGDTALLSVLGFESDNRLGNLGQNAIFEYNGQVLENAKNDVSVNGISLSLRGENETVNLSVNQDSDAIYKGVKDFITKYNELITNINTKLDAKYLKDYAPLTDDEKTNMSDDDIKAWEIKIKGSILRRDSQLSNVSTKMRNILTGSAGIDSTGFVFKNLSELGIITGNYTEKGILHIQGDSEDIIFGDKEDKLRTAIENNPEEVEKLLRAVGTKLYDTLNESMKSTELKSALNFYNDKHMTEQIKNYETKISDLEEDLIRIEDRYYSQFTVMEKMIQQSNSKSDWITQQLGGQ